MQINSASSYTPQSAQSIGADNQTQVNDQRDRLVVQQEQKKTQQDSSPKNQQNRLDIDPQAIALVEQNLKLNEEQNTPQRSSRQSIQPDYDQPSQQNKTAVLAYQSVDNIDQRDSVKQAFGVDLYA